MVGVALPRLFTCPKKGKETKIGALKRPPLGSLFNLRSSAMEAEEQSQ